MDDKAATLAGGWTRDPDHLWHTSGLGREEFVQKLLSALIFGCGEFRWNTPGPPSTRGLRFLCSLAEQHLGTGCPSDSVFVDEFELPRRHDDERAGWPDQAVMSEDTLLLIELKTEKRSHRHGQLDHYLELAAHHHPDRAIVLLYVTPSMTVPAPSRIPDGARYAHASWGQVAPLIEQVWADGESWEPIVAERLAWWLGEVEAQRPAPARSHSPVPPFPEQRAAVLKEAALRLALTVQRTGQQAAVDGWPGSPDLLDQLRLEVRAELRAGTTIEGHALPNVLPWLWSAGSSGGQPLTRTGRVHGYELRLSRYASARWRG